MLTEHLKELVVKNHPQTQLTYIGGDYAENYAKAIQLIWMASIRNIRRKI